MLQRQPKTTLMVDVSNILFRVAAVQKHSNPGNRGAKPEDLVGLCMHISLQSIMKWYNKIKPDFVVFAFEGGNSWRKKYSKERNLIRQYKGNRVVDPEMNHFYELVSSFKEVMQNYTSICCLSVDTMEADDCFAAYVELTSGLDETVIGLSGDKDFIQLLKYDHFRLMDPDTGKLRNQPDSKNYEPDLDYWLFLKCVRGDAGDNVPSAYPRVRETVIRAAYEDPLKRINFMKTEWVNELSETVVVQNLFEHNKVLMDLHAQPTEAREQLLLTVIDQVLNTKKYSHFHFLQFLKKFGLENLASDAKKFIDLFANNQMFLLGQKNDSKQNIQQPEINETTEVKGLVF